MASVAAGTACSGTSAPSAEDDGDCSLGKLDIVSVSNPASASHSPRTDSTTDSSGEPQHIALDEAYWSPASEACDPATTRIVDGQLATTWEAYEQHQQQLAAWHHHNGLMLDEEMLLPPGLLDPSGEMGSLVDMGDMSHYTAEQLAACAEHMEQMAAYEYDEMAACHAELAASEYSTPLLGPLSSPALEPHEMPPGLSDVWAAGALSERMHFDRLTHAAFGSCNAQQDIASQQQQQQQQQQVDEALRTTVMIRNLPGNFNRQCLLEVIDSEGFAGRYDFVYLPIDFTSAVNLGYAFIDLISPDDARQFMEHFTGFTNWPASCTPGCDKETVVSWSSPHQGLEQHVERYRSSPVMHSSIPEDWKPLIFLNGVRISFPPPTKHIKAPKVRGRPEAVANAVAAGLAGASRMA